MYFMELLKIRIYLNGVSIVIVKCEMFTTFKSKPTSLNSSIGTFVSHLNLIRYTYYHHSYYIFLYVDLKIDDTQRRFKRLPLFSVNPF